MLSFTSSVESLIDLLYSLFFSAVIIIVIIC